MNDSARPPRPDELDSIETASRDEIATLQLARLRETLQRAYENVAHYRTSFDAAGVSPADLQSLDDCVPWKGTIPQRVRIPPG